MEEVNNKEDMNTNEEDENWKEERIMSSNTSDNIPNFKTCMFCLVFCVEIIGIALYF